MTRRRALTIEERDFLDQVRDAIREVEPHADVILYGSRARGDFDEESDWDLLVLVDGTVAYPRERVIADRLFHLGLETGAVLCPVIHSRAEWDSALYRAMPFHWSVDRDGVHL